MSDVSHELLRLYDQYDAWINGRIQFTVAEALTFKRDLRKAIAQVGLLEIGLNSATMDAVAAACAPDSNVVLLSMHRIERIVQRAVNEGEPA
ncbi:hypothetical protein LQG66_03945 [Bradyrhizobium ontarionense]|uniref:Uncharacterized protein n=1 Tax=Bradyrhizobium ontarionense TaxID=2898149 RepID=A0ABY3RE19_9BRAD|nr:hypothetical protein [Bradyrhizobium sp. A19]UFZ05479.1 hypothetical protein LQG66_03945 [Bradyrhizobium sp. A19]